MTNKKNVRLLITGRVQGVGFRPTVYRYATELNLCGFVKNTTSGVICEIEGHAESVDEFINRIQQTPPKQAVIEGVSIECVDLKGDAGFKIISSEGSGDLIAGMPPDMATCDDCTRELFDKTDRRHEYPFINCTNCGPRFTIIHKLPYDRDKTSMRSFALCPDCDREYHDPKDRRFDAQPNACPACGPQLRLIDATGNPAAGDPLEQTSALLKKGLIVAIKGLGGYHLACDALNDKAVVLLRERKRRPAKAFAVMCSSIEQTRDYCHISDEEEAMLVSFARPVVILRRREPCALSAYISPDTTTIGVFLPYTPLHHLLMKKISPLVMTSCNLSDEPIVRDEHDLKPVLGAIADYALIHNRAIVRRCDDSVLQNVAGKNLFIRRSRGYVPDRISLPFEGPSVLACGAELKNTFCITRRNQAFVSQHIGDLTEYKAYEFFCESVDDLIRLLQVNPEIVAYDMHPDYLSTKYALTLLQKNKIAIQHHHAHIASCMVENNCNKPVIGVALDGTGYGTDGTIWGGEFFVADLCNFRRIAHLKQYPLPGADAAILHPIRMALSMCIIDGLYESDPFCRGIFEKKLRKGEASILIDMIHNSVNAPLCSSCGRLFDAVAALCGLCDSITYEAQAAIRLQFAAKPSISGQYPFEIFHDKENCDVISFTPMIRGILGDLKRKKDAGIIAALFHNTVAASVTDMCLRARNAENLNEVILSGGVFQNTFFLDLVVKELEKNDFKVYVHTMVPPNDGGIALGQAGIALARYCAGLTKE